MKGAKIRSWTSCAMSEGRVEGQSLFGVLSLPEATQLQDSGSLTKTL